VSTFFLFAFGCSMAAGCKFATARRFRSIVWAVCLALMGALFAIILVLGQPHRAGSETGDLVVALAFAGLSVVVTVSIAIKNKRTVASAKSPALGPS
jgi:hypothetical protein